MLDVLEFRDYVSLRKDEGDAETLQQRCLTLKGRVSEEFSQGQSMALDRHKIRIQRTKGAKICIGLSCAQCHQPGEYQGQYQQRQLQ